MPVVLACLLAMLVTTATRGASAESALPPAALREIGIDQRLGEQLPLDLAFFDETGQRVELERYFGERPVVLALVYNACPMLCQQVLHGMMASLRTLQLDAGRDFEVLVVSFDPEEPTAVARATRDKMVERYARAGSEQGFHVLTGSPASIAALTEAVGFRYTYDDKLGQYAHASALFVLTPEGKVARYFFGTEYSPRDMRLAMVEATEGKLGSLTDDLLLLCYRYDPASGGYSASVMGAVRIGAVATMLGLVVFVGASMRRERRRRKEPPP
jgi:protein SCO1/2